MTDRWPGGTDDEFKAFVLARWPELVRYAYLLVGDRQHAEDVVQVALEDTWRRWRRARIERPEAYVRRAVARRAVSWQRRLGRRVAERPVGESLPEPELGAWGADGPEGLALRDLVWSELGQLPPRMRAVVVLRIWEDLGEKETAEVLGCSVGAVKSQLSRGLARLRTHPALRDVAGVPARDASARPSLRSLDDPAR